MNCRFLICIPVYNNPETVASVIAGCLATTDDPVLVLDDGSDVPVQTLVPADARLSFFRQEVNQGKGVAIKRAFKIALEKGYTHLLTIDADGQHDFHDIPRLVQAALQNPMDLIVGDRDMATENVPGSSTFGKKFSNFWVRYQTEISVADSQSGFRVYPLFAVQTMNFYCRHYDFEVEVLTRLIWRGVRVRNVKISVKYFPPESRVSHFHKWRDNFRITVANTWLTTAAVLRDRGTPIRNAAAVGLGVFVGCTPLYGLHTGIVVLLALLFRMNVIYLWVGSNVSIPPLIPFLVLASNRLGQIILGGTQEGAAEFTKAWLVGSLGLGIILGSCTFLIVALATTGRALFSGGANLSLGGADGDRAAAPPAKPKTWTGKNQNRLGVAIVRQVMTFFGLRSAYLFLHLIVFYYFLFSRRSRRAFSEYWKVTHPQFGFWTRQRKMYGQILMFAQTLVDRGFQKQRQTVAFQMTVDASAKEAISGQLGKCPTGTVLLATHFGGWELAMSFLSKTNRQSKMTAVMYGIPGQIEHRSDQSSVIHFNQQENTMLKLRDQLGRGQFVGMMGDRPVSRSYELVPFFKGLVFLDSTPVRLALACKSDLYFVFAPKEGLKEYRIFADKYLWQPGLKNEEQVTRALACYAKRLETMIVHYPDQWFNFFPFWSKAQPWGET